MRGVRILLIVALSGLLAMGCGEGGEGQAGVIEAATNESAPASGETGTGDPSRTVPSGGSVETCGGDDISLNAYGKRLLELHNQTREARGLATLCVHPALTEAARSYSEKMIEEDFFSHTSPDGESLGRSPGRRPGP